MVGKVLSVGPPSGEHFTKHAPNTNHPGRRESYMFLEFKNRGVT